MKDNLILNKELLKKDKIKDNDEMDKENEYAANFKGWIKVEESDILNKEILKK